MATRTSTSTNNKSHVTSRRLPMSYYFILTCSLFLSHPLYLYSSYFILLLPYFLKFLSFLSPLFITTSLVLLLLLTFSPGLIVDKNSIITAQSKLGFFRGYLEKLRPNAGDEEEESVHQGSEECEVYKILFEVPEVEVEVGVGVEAQENGLELEPKHELAPVDKFLICGEDGVRDDVKIENSDEMRQDAKTSTVEEDSRAGGQKNRTLEGLFSEKVEPPEYDAEQGGGRAEEAAAAKAKQWDSHSQSKRGGEAKEDPIENMESDPLCNKEVVIIDNIKERDGVRFTRRLGGSVRLTSSEYKIGYKEMRLDNYRYSALGGSMRREKEWKRTLACKLYEERNGGRSDDDDRQHDDGDENGEGMDLLWETYENDSTTTTITTIERQTKSKTEKSKSYDDDDDEEEEDEEEKLCCLRVLKFSAGKMGRRPNLVKISKALTFRGVGLGLGLGLGFLKHKHGIRTG